MFPTHVSHFILKAFYLLLLLPMLAVAQTKVPVSLGTGFVVSNEGHVVTAYHVIRNKAQVLVGPIEKNRWRIAKVIKIDEAKDLALLKVRIDRPALPLVEWREVPIGLEALVIGFPQPKLQGLSKKITQGIVNGDRTESGDEGYFQLSAEVNKGNSGGPVLAPDGSVIGVVRSKLNALSVAEKTGDLSQNVNYALKSASLKEFLLEAEVPIVVRSLNLSTAARPYETYLRAEASVLAVLGRDVPKVTGESSVSLGEDAPTQTLGH